MEGKKKKDKEEKIREDRHLMMSHRKTERVRGLYMTQRRLTGLKKQDEGEGEADEEEEEA